MQNLLHTLFLSWSSLYFKLESVQRDNWWCKATLRYSVSIWTVKEQHLLKPEACFKAVMEEVVTASLQLILGRKKRGMIDGWTLYLTQRKTEHNVNCVQAGCPGIHKKARLKFTYQLEGSDVPLEFTFIWRFGQFKALISLWVVFGWSAIYYNVLK